MRTRNFSNSNSMLPAIRASLMAASSFVMLCALFGGCATDATKVASDEKPSSNSHQNLSLHKPKDLASAAARLGELHHSLVSSDKFPSPREIEIVEVVHGEGPSGHSHFYLASKYDETGGEIEHEEGYPGEEVEEKVKRHVMELAARKEISDVAGWLPDIAAWASVPESDWTTAYEVSKGLVEIIGAIPEDASNEAFRDAWKSKSKDIEGMLEELESIAAKPAGDAK